MLKEWSFMEQNREIMIGKKNFELLEFYIRSLERNVLEPFLISTNEENDDGSMVQLKVTAKDRGNIVNSLWLLTAIFSKGYPIIENVAILQEFAQILSQHLNWKELSSEELDKLIEINSLYDNSLSRNALSQVFNLPNIKEVVDERLKTIYENSVTRRKNIRSELENLTKEIFGNQEITVSQGVVLSEKIVVDLLIKTDNMKYVLLSYPVSLENSQVKLNQLLEDSGSSNPLHSPLKERVLTYKGYSPLFINMKDWINLNALQRKKLLNDFYDKKQ